MDPHPVIVTLRNNGDYILLFLPYHYFRVGESTKHIPYQPKFSGLLALAASEQKARAWCLRFLKTLVGLLSPLKHVSIQGPHETNSFQYPLKADPEAKLPNLNDCFYGNRSAQGCGTSPLHLKTMKTPALDDLGYVFSHCCKGVLGSPGNCA